MFCAIAPALIVSPSPSAAAMAVILIFFMSISFVFVLPGGAATKTSVADLPQP
jgi:hypothetical protein